MRNVPVHFATLLLLLFGPQPGWGNETEWLSQFGTAGYDDGTAIAIHSTGVYVTGRQGTSGFLRKYDFSGKEVWTRRFAGTEPFAVAADDTGVYLAGRAENGAFAHKYDHAGNSVWAHFLTSGDRATSMSEAWGIAVHSTGVYVAGDSYSDCQDNCLTSALVKRLDLAGNEIWTAIAGTPFDHPFGYREDARATGIAVDATGVYVTGALGTADARRYDFNGNPTGVFGVGTLWGAGLVLDDSGIYIGGLPCPPQCQFATSVRKYLRDGTELWTRELPSEFEGGGAVALDGDGGIYITGWLVHDFPKGPFNAYVRKYTTDGGFLWTDEFGAEPGFEIGSGIAADPSGVYVTGFTDGTFPGQVSTPNQDIFVIKRNENVTPKVRALSLGDINHDGTPELAAIGHDAHAQTQINWVVIKNAMTHVTVRKFEIADEMPAADGNVVPDLSGNGAPELAILSAKTRHAAVHDSLTGTLLSNVAFDPTFTPTRIASVPDQNANGASELAVLQENDSTLRVEVRDAKNGALVRHVGFGQSQSFRPKDLAVLPDINQNGSVELAVLAQSAVEGKSDEVKIRDSVTGESIHNVSFGRSGGVPKQLVVVPDINGNGAYELAVVRTGSTRVVVKDAQTGEVVSVLAYNKAYRPLRLAVVPDFSGNGLPELALWGVRATDGKVRAAIMDVATRQWLGAAYYGIRATVRADDGVVIPDINGNGVPELVRLGVRGIDSKVVADIRDVLTGSVAGKVIFYP
jgi:hypothetical protein